MEVSWVGGPVEPSWSGSHCGLVEVSWSGGRCGPVELSPAVVAPRLGAGRLLALNGGGGSRCGSRCGPTLRVGRGGGKGGWFVLWKQGDCCEGGMRLIGLSLACYALMV